MTVITLQNEYQSGSQAAVGGFSAEPISHSVSENRPFVCLEEIVVGKAATVFRIIAVAEALSWAALLAGMFVKYVIEFGEGGVPVIGMVHGILFAVYVVTTLAVHRIFGWDGKTLLLALAASVPPLCTWWFELWALRSGKFDGPEIDRHAGVALYLPQGREQAPA